jgi:hypothetical protein
MPPTDKRAAIVYANDHAAVVADLDRGAEWQRAKCGGHGCTIHTLAVCSAAPTVAILSAIDTRDFRVCRVDRDVSEARH